MLLVMRHFPAGAEGQAYWVHLDGRGSVAGLTKHQGQSTHNYRYDAFGQVLPAEGNWTDPHNHYTFLGKEWDEHLGLYEFGVRLYDPWAGVWRTREPLPGEAWEPRTWHRYQYAYASPISYYDPYGMQTCGFNILTGERECFGERTGMGWTPTLAAPGAGLPVGATALPCTQPSITVFVWQMMQEAYRSQVAQWIRFLNQTCYQCAWEGVPWWARGEDYTRAVQADAFSRLWAYALWAWMVRQGGPWDPKPKIAEEFGYYQDLGDGYQYYYDVWGNVMYGYLGAATGFSEAELLHGAGAEQIGSSLGYSFEQLLREGRIDPERLPQRRINVSGLAAFDLPEDRVGIQIGIRLWQIYRSELTPESLLEEIRKQGAYLKRVPSQSQP